MWILNLCKAKKTWKYCASKFHAEKRVHLIFILLQTLTTYIEHNIPMNERSNMSNMLFYFISFCRFYIYYLCWAELSWIVLFRFPCLFRQFSLFETRFSCICGECESVWLVCWNITIINYFTSVCCVRTLYAIHAFNIYRWSLKFELLLYYIEAFQNMLDILIYT